MDGIALIREDLLKPILVYLPMQWVIFTEALTMLHNRFNSNP
jgi:hypothetical protein